MKIFIINLKRAKDRKEFMQKQVDKLNYPEFEFIFFDAIDAKNQEHHHYDEYYRSFLTKLYRAKDSTDGERACYASHFSLWQKCLELNESIIVLEDDIELLPDFIEGIKRISSSSYDYVRLIATDKPKKPFIPIEENFVLTYDELAGAQGYYLSPKAARKFIKGSKYWVLPVDNYMDRISMHGVKSVLHMPFLIKGDDQMGQNTTIPNRYDKKIKKSLIWKLLREIYRFFIQIKQNLYIALCKKGVL